MTLTYKEQVERTLEIELPYYAKEHIVKGISCSYWAITGDDGNKNMHLYVFADDALPIISGFQAERLPLGHTPISQSEFMEAFDSAFALYQSRFNEPVIR